MTDLRSAPAVVVGIDGSKSAVEAAVWAIGEAVSKDIPLRLVYVVDPADSAVAGSDHGRYACARAALYDAQRTVEAAGEPVKVEVEIRSGKPVAELARASRSAAMISVGAIGSRHALRGTGSVATALPGLAQCPVAVIRPAQRRPAAPAGLIVVQANNAVALRHAFDEARLRGVPLRAVTTWRAEAPDDIGDGSRLARAQLNRQLAPWMRLYPDVPVESVVVRGGLCEYLAKNPESIEIFVTETAGSCCGSGGPGHLECSVLTVRGSRL